MSAGRRSVTLAGVEYMSKAAIRRRAQEIWAGPDRVLTGAERDFAEALLGHHPERETKVGNGIEAFRVGNNVHGTRSFWVTRTDGTVDDFSVDRCELAIFPSVRRAGAGRDV